MESIIQQGEAALPQFQTLVQIIVGFFVLLVTVSLAAAVGWFLADLLRKK